MSIRKLNLISSNSCHMLFAIFLIFGTSACGGGIQVGGPASVAPSPKDFTSGLVSRTAGIAPLSVFFDATNTTSASTTSPFHSLQYSWDFGDLAGSTVSGTTWSVTGSQSATASCNAVTTPSTPIGCRNSATSAVAAHIYENAGTFSPILTVYDGVTGSTITYPLPAITVSTFAGTTYCIYSSVPYHSCPNAGTEHLSSDFHAAISAAIAAGAHQILFQRGDSFTSTTQSNISAAGPGIIGAYGAAATATPIISGVLPQQNQYLSFTGADWRVIDIKFDGAGSTNQTAIVASAKQISVLRVTAVNLNLDMNTGSDQIFVQDTNFSQGASTSSGSNYGFYCASCTNIALLGNTMNINTINSHNIRLDGGVKFVIENSTQVGGSAIEPFTIRGNSSYGAITDNSLQVSMATIQPQNSTSNENQHDIIVERNYFTGAPGLGIQASYITVRNNIFNIGSGSNTDAIHLSWTAAGVAPEPSHNFIYNNTAYYNGSNPGSSFLVTYAPLDSLCTVTLENNLAYFPSSSGATLVNGNGACTFIGGSGTYGNSSNSQITGTSPNWKNASGTYLLPTDFKPNIGSYAINAGYTPSPELWTDFFCTARMSPYDTGAINH